MNLWCFEEGYLRLSSEKYSLSDLDDLYVHLTNNAIQKHSTKYNDQWNLLSYDQYSQYLSLMNSSLCFATKRRQFH